MRPTALLFFFAGLALAAPTANIGRSPAGVLAPRKSKNEMTSVGRFLCCLDALYDNFYRFDNIRDNPNGVIEKDDVKDLGWNFPRGYCYEGLMDWFDKIDIIRTPGQKGDGLVSKQDIEAMRVTQRIKGKADCNAAPNKQDPGCLFGC